MKGNILCIIDGMAGDGLEKYCSTFKYIQTNFAYGHIDCTPTGLPTESMSCILNILGVNINIIKNCGRAWLEAVGAGIILEENDLVMRGSWVEINSDGRVNGFCSSPNNIKKHENIKYFSLNSYKSILVLPGYAHYFSEIQTYPPHQNFGELYSSLVPRYPRDLAQFCLKNMDNTYGLVPWAQSKYTQIPKVDIASTVVSGIHLINGMAKLMGMKSISYPDFTGDIDTNLIKKVGIAIEEAEKNEFVVVHINGADEAAHRKDTRQKKEFLKKVDKYVFRELLNSDHNFIICSDHATSSSTGEHVKQHNIFGIKKEGLQGNLGNVDCGCLMSLLLMKSLFK